MPEPIQPRVLVVDDDTGVASAIAAMVRMHGYQAVVTHNVDDALAAFDASAFDIVLTDVRMGVLGGFDLLHRVRERSRYVPVVLITGEATVEDAIDAIQAGAHDYLSKPVRVERIGQVLERAMNWRRMAADVAGDIEGLTSRPPLGAIIGRSGAIFEAFKTVARVAEGEATVLILGENGTGKGLVARELHGRSQRAARPFVPVNMASIAAGLAESELFGHRKYAFTDARREHRGLFEQANGGTLFFDEIGDLDPQLQPKLLRAIQEKRIKPVGAEEEIPVDVRIVSATNRDLEQRVRSGAFREDLFYRLNVVTIHLPPLRERSEDIQDLAEHFLTLYASRTRKPRPRLTPQILDLLCAYPWPGNVRELENVIQRAVQLSTLGVITPDMLHLGQATSAPPPPSTRRRQYPTLEQMKDDYIREVLEYTNGNVTQAARILKISRKTIQRFAARGRTGPGDGDNPSHPESSGPTEI